MNHPTRWKQFAIFSIFIFIPVTGLFTTSGLAQGNENDMESLIQRLAQLEQRQAALEQENQSLRDRLASLESAGPAGSGSPPLQAAATAPAAPTEAPPQRVTFGAQIRFRPESRSNFTETNPVNNVVLQRIRLNARLRLSENLSGLVQLQDSRLWGQEGSTASNESNIDLHQAYFQVDEFLHPRLSLRLGRQEVSYGNQRLIGAFGWNNIGRSFDALKLTYAAPQWSSEFLFSRVTDRRNSNRGDGSQDLIGLYTRIGPSASGMGLEPYVLYLRDGREIGGEASASLPEATRIVTLGFRHFAAFQSGFRYDMESAYQAGQRGPDTHRAAAVAASARYRFAARFSPEFGFEYDFATGDSDPQDGRSGEFHNLFPTNHLHYGYGDYMGWRNMQDFKPYFAFLPRANVRTQVSYHRLLLAEERGAWKNAGGKVLGIDPTGLLGTDLGHEIDLTLAFPLYEQVRMLAGYSVFLPGEFARGTQGSQASQFGYLQTLVTF